MRTINSLFQAVEKADLPYAIENSLSQTAPDYIDLQRQQMFSGVLSDGTEIERIGAKYKGYAPMTIKIKERKGQPTDRITLKDTGSFYADINVDARAEGMAVDSGDSKSEKLQKDYGKKIFGLDDDQRQAYVNKLRPVFVSEIENELNKK